MLHKVNITRVFEGSEENETTDAKTLALFNKIDTDESIKAWDFETEEVDDTLFVDFHILLNDDQLDVYRSDLKTAGIYYDTLTD